MTSAKLRERLALIQKEADRVQALEMATRLLFELNKEALTKDERIQILEKERDLAKTKAGEAFKQLNEAKSRIESLTATQKRIEFLEARLADMAKEKPLPYPDPEKQDGFFLRAEKIAAIDNSLREHLLEIMIKANCLKLAEWLQSDSSGERLRFLMHLGFSEKAFVLSLAGDWRQEKFHVDVKGRDFDIKVSKTALTLINSGSNPFERIAYLLARNKLLIRNGQILTPEEEPQSEPSKIVVIHPN